MDLTGDLGYPGSWHLIETEPGTWRLEHDGTHIASIRRAWTHSAILAGPLAFFGLGGFGLEEVAGDQDA